MAKKQSITGIIDNFDDLFIFVSVIVSIFAGAKVAINDTIYHKISFISYHFCCIVTSVTLLETIEL